MASIMGNPLQSVAANIQDMQKERAQCTAEISELEREKAVIHQAMGLVFDRLVEQNDKLGRLMQERNAFDRAIGEMSQAFDQIVATSRTLVGVGQREQEGIDRQRKQLDLVAQGISLEQQMEQAHAEQMAREADEFSETNQPLHDPRSQQPLQGRR
eukprot:g662.t1